MQPPRKTAISAGVVLCAALSLVALPTAAQDDVPDQELGLPPAADDEASEEVSDEPSDEPAGARTSSRRRAGAAGSAQMGGESARPPAGGPHGSSGQQTQVLATGTLRIEAGPVDFALRDSGFLAEGRGLRIGRADLQGESNPYAGLGLGLSYCVIENLEVGLLQLPIIFANGFAEADFGNIELHGRYGFFQGGPVELGAQLAVQLPSNRTFGVGLGLPVRIFAMDELVIDTGFELEVVTFIPSGADADTIVNLDIPVAVNYYIVPEAFVGGRIGLFAWDLGDAEMLVPLGVQGGYTLADGMVALTGWFQWAAIPLGEFRYTDDLDPDPLEAGSFEFGVGANVLLGLSR